MDASLTVLTVIALLVLAIGANVLIYQIVHLSKALREIQSEVLNVHRTFNSKMDALLTVTGQAEHAKGVLEGRAERQQDTQTQSGELATNVTS